MVYCYLSGYQFRNLSFLTFLDSGGQAEGSESVTTAALDALVSVTQMVPASDVAVNTW